MITELSTETAAAIAVELGVVREGSVVSVRPLSGGISNTVLAVEGDDRRLVLKQSLPRLRVAADWRFDRSRTHVERDCMVYLATILPAGSVPEVIASRDEDFLFAMTQAPDGGVLWKEALLRGDVDISIAARVGQELGAVHATSAVGSVARERFADRMPLMQGRVDPYHRTAAAANPDLAHLINDEIERLLNTRRSLVLGDYAPKNIIAYPNRVMILDFEVAHWGDPAFDVGFMLTHLILKSRVRPEASDDLLEASRAFWAEYCTRAGPHRADEAAVVAELGCLMLSRVDGKSPVEYLTEDAQRASVRQLAGELLVGDERRLDPILQHAIGAGHRSPV